MQLSNQSTIMVVEKEELEEIVKNAIREMIESNATKQNNGKSVGDYIPQSEAMKTLNRKTTWFHLKRKSGELPATKSGNQWWYLKDDIESFIKNGIVSND